jgi:uncharacterized protein (DUF433 family)
VRRKLGRIKVDIIVEAARLGMATNRIAERAKVPVEDVEEILRLWHSGPSAGD